MNVYNLTISYIAKSFNFGIIEILLAYFKGCVPELEVLMAL